MTTLNGYPLSVYYVAGYEDKVDQVVLESKILAQLNRLEYIMYMRGRADAVWRLNNAKRLPDVYVVKKAINKPLTPT